MCHRGNRTKPISNSYSYTLSRAVYFRLARPTCTGQLQSPIYCDKPAFILFCTPEETRTPILRFRRPSCFIAPQGHICRWEKIRTSILQIQSLRYSTNYTTHPYCGTYGFEPPVIGSFSLFHPVSICTQLALSPIYFCRSDGIPTRTMFKVPHKTRFPT